jgi:hypothetical protein
MSVWLAQLLSYWPAHVCTHSCMSIQDDRDSSTGTDKANQAFHPFGVSIMGSSLHIVGYCYRRLRISNTEGR